MGVKEMLEMEDAELSEEEIMQKIVEALEKNSETITLPAKSGSITIKLPNINFSKHIDPWDGKQTGGTAH